MAAKSQQLMFRPKGQTTCPHHKGKQLELFCKTCQQPACIKCLSSVHKDHIVRDIEEISSQKKSGIQDFIDKTEKTELPQADKHIISTDTLLRDNSSHFKKVATELKEQNDKIKQDLDLLLAETLSLYQKMEDENASLIRTYKSNLESYRVQLNELVKECKAALQRGTDIEIYDTACEINVDVTQPNAPTLGTASFTPNTTPRGYLEQAFGIVTISGPGQASADHDGSVGSSGHQGPQQRSASDDGRPVTRPPSQYTLLPQTKVLGEFTSPCDIMISSLCPTSDGGAWVCYWGSPTLTLLDRRGTTQQEITYNNDIADISRSHNTHSVWSCHWEDNSIMELVSGKPTLRFKVDSEPQCICVTGDGHIIVGMAKYISKFTTKGKVVLTTKAAGAGRPFVCTPWRITECHVTGNVAVADLDQPSHGGEGRPHVLVMDKNFRELFRYRGEIPRSSQPNTRTGLEQFSPWGLVYDSVGNLVIGDNNNNSSVLLISGRGEFLRTIHTDTDNTETIGIDRRDVVWAEFGWDTCNVKLLQYTSV